MTLIDSDFHVTWSDNAALAEYLPKAWQQRFLRGSGHSQSGLPVTQPFYNPAAQGQPGGWSEPEAAVTWMENHQVGKAILHAYQAPAVSNFGDADYPSLLAEAFNQWLIDHWLDGRTELLGTMTVATQDPVRAGKEIRKRGSHPQIVQVALSAGTLQPYGKLGFRPIFEAAAEMGLPVVLHAGTEGVAVSNPPSSHGWPRNLLEYRVCPATNFIAHLTSLITEGLFSDLPDLRLVGLEVGGVLPLITYLWRFDKNYKALRSECPWVRELPSAVVKRHVRLGTGSAAIGEEHLYFELLESFGADEMLLWSSNQPRWDAVEPESDPHLKERTGWQVEKVGRENAAALYGMTSAL